MTLKGVIVPASRAGSGIGWLGARPLAMLQRVANRPILCHVLEQLRDAGVREVALLVSHAAVSEVQACTSLERPAGIDIRYLTYQEDETFETALQAVARFVGETPCIVHAADGLLAQPLAPLVELMADDAADLLALLHNRAAGVDSIGLATRRLVRLTGTAAASGDAELAGVCLLGAGALRRAGATQSWPERELDIVSLAERLVDAGGRLRIEHVRGWRRYTGEAADLLELNRFTLDALSTEPLLRAGSDNRIEGCVAIHPTASVESSTIVGPAIVGAGASVVESYIGPYTSIGAGVHIEGAEVERSIILAGASVRYVGGRLVASVVGRDARIFRDFSLPRALRMNVGDGGEVALC